MSAPDPHKRKPNEVRAMFARIAPLYDKINRAMCFGMDRRWRTKLAKCACQDIAETVVLDLACGSGDVALAILEAYPQTRVVCCDLCPDMLSIAKEKIETAGFASRAEFICADASNMPFENETFSACTISFGFRNFEDRAICLCEIARILKPRSKLAILEVARAPGFFEPVQNFFMGKCVPNIASLLGGNKDDYAYLAKTTREFPNKAELKKIIEDGGFDFVTNQNFAFGFVALTSAKKI